MKSGKMHDHQLRCNLSMLTLLFKTSQWQGCMSLSLDLSPRHQLDDQGAWTTSWCRLPVHFISFLSILKNIKFVKLRADLCGSYIFCWSQPAGWNSFRVRVISPKRIKKLSRQFAFFYFVGLITYFIYLALSLSIHLFLASAHWHEFSGGQGFRPLGSFILGASACICVLRVCNCTITDIDASGPCRHTPWTNQQESNKFSPDLITTTSTQRCPEVLQLLSNMFQNRKEYQLLSNP
jgi:hypothetical protein